MMSDIFWYNIRKLTSEESIVNELKKTFGNRTIELFDFLHCPNCELSFFECHIEDESIIIFENGYHNCMRCTSDINLCHACCHWQL